MVLAPERQGSGTGGDAPGETPPPSPPRRGILRRHRAIAVLVALSVLLVAGAGGFAWRWTHSGPHELSGATALHRFRSGSSPVFDPGTLRPKAGVYSYTGQGTDHVSVPPKTMTEGPHFPGTVRYLAGGCWEFRVDYSDSHWQSTTYCPRAGNLVEVGRAGWYRWDFVAFAVADTATFTCQEMAVPAVLAKGQDLSFSCTGRNDPLDTGTVTITGTTRYLGTETVHVGSTAVRALHFREVARMGGGQSGTTTSDLWMSTADGLPVRGSWTTDVRTPSPLGTSTMVGSAQFHLASLTPRS